jgi:hypothetical protein
MWDYYSHLLLLIFTSVLALVDTSILLLYVCCLCNSCGVGYSRFCCFIFIQRARLTPLANSGVLDDDDGLLAASFFNLQMM